MSYRKELSKKQKGTAPEAPEDKLIPTYCYLCNAGGPDLVKVRVRSGIPIAVEPNYDFPHVHARGDHGSRPCSKAMGLIWKYFNPNRVKAPMKRTNPNKGKDQDPGFVEISWDEALELFAKKLLEVKAKGFFDENGYWRIACVEGGDGAPPTYNGTMAVMFGGAAIVTGAPQGLFPSDCSLAPEAFKCYHTEHVLGEMWNKAFVIKTDTPRCNLIISFGRSYFAISGQEGAIRLAEAKRRGMKRIQIEPVLTTTGAMSDEWVPIKSGTDAAFIYAMIHHILHELDWRSACDIEHLKRMTNSPYLVAPNGYYLRDPETKKPYIWDPAENKARVWDAEDIRDFALDGEYEASGITIGPDDEVEKFNNAKVKPAFQLLIEHVKDNTPEWASKICDVPAETIRHVADELVENANAAAGATIKMFGLEMPFRPVSIDMGKGVNAGRGSIPVVWGVWVLLTLFGAIEVPGGLVGSNIIFSGPLEPKTVEGFAQFPHNPTSKEGYKQITGRRDCVTGLYPQATHFFGPTHLAYHIIQDPPPNWPKASPPDVLITFRSNLLISYNDLPLIEEVIKRIPFIASFVHTIDETSWFADLILPEDSDLETLQTFPLSGNKDMEISWEYSGLAIKQPCAKRLYNTMNITDIMTELAYRTGMLAEYNEFINSGKWMGYRLKDTPWELEPDKKYSAEEIYDRVCKAMTTAISHGQATFGLDWLKQAGAFLAPYPQDTILQIGSTCLRPWFLYPIYKSKGMRFELPYQERLKKVHEELRRRLHERNIYWWDPQLDGIDFLPKYEDVSEIWDTITKDVYGKKPEDYPFWLLCTRSTLYGWGSNMCLAETHELAQEVLGHTSVEMNKKAAEQLGIKTGDQIWIESPYEKIKGRVMLRQGIRPDVVLTTAQYGHWATPFAKDLGIPNMNKIQQVLIESTEALGSTADKIKVKVYKAEE